MLFPIYHHLKKSDLLLFQKKYVSFPITCLDMALTQRLSVVEYLKRVGERLPKPIVKQLQEIILQFLRPGIVCSRNETNDLFYFINYWHHISNVDDTPLHFILSRVNDANLRKLITHFFNTGEDIMRSPIANQWLNMPFLTENEFLFFCEVGSRSTTYTVVPGQTFQDVLSALPLCSNFYKVDYVHVSIDRVICELTPGQPLDIWGQLNTETCVVCKIVEEDPSQFFRVAPPRGRRSPTKSRCFSRQERPKLQWMYCQQCRAGPFCSDTCVTKCPHFGFVSLDYTCLKKKRITLQKFR